MKFGFNLVSERCALLCSSILLQRLSYLLLLCSVVDTIHDERLRAVMFLTLGLVGIHLRLGFLFQKSRKQIMRALGRLEAAARGEAAIFRTAMECMNCSCEISHLSLIHI